VATAVGNAAIKDGVAQIEAPDDLEAYMADRMWCVSQADPFLGSCSIRYMKRGAVMTGCSCAAIIAVHHALQDAWNLRRQQLCSLPAGTHKTL